MNILTSRTNLLILDGESTYQMSDGAVVISLDTELEWGFHSLDVDHHLSRDGSRERANTDRLLRLFDEYRTPVTWAIVGHLFLDRCGGSHPDICQPTYPWLRGDWWEDDPGGSKDTAALRYGPDIVQSILDADVDHEIGTHTFSHVLCDYPGCSPKVLRDELQVCQELAEEHGIELFSLVYPQNRVDYLDVLADSGIRVFRSRSPDDRMVQKSGLGQYFLYAKTLLKRPAPTVEPIKVRDHLWSLPASQHLHYKPPRFERLNRSLSLRASRGIRAIRRVSENGGVYHLWTHPHDFDETMFRDLRAILEATERHSVPVLTMRDLIRKKES